MGAVLGHGTKGTREHGVRAGEKNVKKLEGKPESFGQLVSLARANADLEDSKASDKYPKGAALRGAVRGAALAVPAVAAGKSVVSLMKR